MKKLGIGLIAILAMVIVSSLGIQYGFSYNRMESSINGNSTDCWSGDKSKEISLKGGQSIDFDFHSEVRSGELTMSLCNSNGEIVLDLGVGVKDDFLLEVDKTDNYYLQISGDEFNGSFDVSWKVNG